MNRNEFLLQVLKFFQRRPCENALSAQNALMILYDYLLENARAAEQLPRDSKEWCRQMFIVQQAMTWTPLRLFTRLLVEDELQPIRAAAKGNICEATGFEYWGDPEVGLISRANLPLIVSGATTAIQEEMNGDPRLLRAIQEWEISTQGTRFTPELVVKVLSTEDLEDPQK